MAQDPLKPKDSGKIRMPRVDSSMNKLPPDKGKDYDEDMAIILEAKKRFDRCVQAEADNRSKAEDDLRFLKGDQWSADVAAERATQRRPCLTFNKLLTFVHQVTNDQRQNRPAINISPVGTQTDVEAAQTYAGLIRAIERESEADIAYDTGFFYAAASGWGYWRVLTEYEDDETFDQNIRIARIRNPFTVYLDPDHIEPEGSDAKFGFVTEMITRDQFEEEYPDAQMVSWDPTTTGDNFKNWVEKDRIRVAEYYTIEEEPLTIVRLSNGHVGDKAKLDPKVQKEIDAGRVKIVDERESSRKKVMWYKLTILDVLDRTEIKSDGMIPIVKVIGDEIDNGGKVTYSGIVRAAKDPQRMYNYWRTTEAEVLALQPKTPYIVEEGQIEGHEAQWQNANTSPQPYLQYKGVAINGKPAPPPQRQPLLQGSQAILAAVQGSAQDMQAVTGIRFDATLQERMHDESGKAIRELRRSGDTGSYHYIDNFGRALKYTGRLIIAMIPNYYNTRRTLTIIQADGKEKAIHIDPTAGKALTRGQTPEGSALPIFNPKVGKYGVAVTIGPSFATKRIEASEQMMQFVHNLPQLAPTVADLIAKNMDWPEADQFAARLAKTLPPNLLSPDMKNVDPQVQALVQSQRAMIQKMQMALVQAQRSLQDKSISQKIVADKNEKDFEAKVLAVLQKAQQADQKNNTETFQKELDALHFLHALDNQPGLAGLDIMGPDHA